MHTGIDKTALYQYEKQTGGTETQTITYKTAKVTKNNTTKHKQFNYKKTLSDWGFEWLAGA